MPRKKPGQQPEQSNPAEPGGGEVKLHFRGQTNSEERAKALVQDLRETFKRLLGEDSVSVSTHGCDMSDHAVSGWIAVARGWITTRLYEIVIAYQTGGVSGLYVELEDGDGRRKIFPDEPREAREDPYYEYLTDIGIFNKGGTMG